MAHPDPEVAVRFYGELFGWEFVDRMPADAPGNYFVAQLRGRDVAAIGSQPDATPPAPTWTTYVAVESADDSAAKAKEAGGRALTEPFDVLDAGRMAVLADPSGAVFCVWESNRHKGAQLVNEPGTWNWSDLNTRDPEGAKAFYGAVFGWETSRVTPDEVGDQTMWRLPGYGDFLEGLEPGLRSRQAAQGAPEGFEDAIGWLQPMTNGASPDDVPPHWSVTFTVADTDAIADRAAQLGGTITVPPFDVAFDAGVVRLAVLSDPQGAVFSVNSFAPSA
jgi:predicted enzyme related to lactoylglutathione lyase